MKKLSIREWLKKNYGSNSISIKTIQKRCRRGEISNAIKEGKKWFIMVEEKSHEQR